MPAIRGQTQGPQPPRVAGSGTTSTHIRTLGRGGTQTTAQLLAPTGKEPLVVNPKGKDPKWKPRDGRLVKVCACPHHLSGIVDELEKRGHTRAVVLDEGINDWHRKDYPMTAAEGVPPPTNDTTATITAGMITAGTITAAMATEPHRS